MALGLVEGRDNHPMGWCQDPSQGSVALEMETSLLLHACVGTCHRMLETENKGSLSETDHSPPVKTFVLLVNCAHLETCIGNHPYHSFAKSYRKYVNYFSIKIH